MSNGLSQYCRNAAVSGKHEDVSRNTSSSPASVWQKMHRSGWPCTLEGVCTQPKQSLPYVASQNDGVTTPHRSVVAWQLLVEGLLRSRHRSDPSTAQPEHHTQDVFWLQAVQVGRYPHATLPSAVG